MYLANCTRPDRAFATNLLVRFSSSLTRRHWNDIKHIFRYLRGTTNFDLFYSRGLKHERIGYADAVYLSNLRQDMCSHVEGSLDVHKSKHLLSLLLIMLKS